MLFGDRDLCMEAIANLAQSVVKFYPVHETVTLRLDLRADGATVINVTDQGPGIPEAERDAVFRRFYRADPSRGSDGNGLGLTLVRAIAELHGFTTEIDDAQPGCIISLIAPAPTGPPDNESSPRASQPKHSTAPIGNGIEQVRL